MPVEVQIAAASVTPPPAAIEGWVLGALEGADGGSGDICVRVVDDDEGRRLNRDFRQRDVPTNVLSFPADVDVPELDILGDIVICAGVVAREAAEQGKPYEHHFAHMVVHGVLHLLGYDHESAAEAEAMETLEAEILGRFGIEDPYGEG